MSEAQTEDPLTFPCQTSRNLPPPLLNRFSHLNFLFDPTPWVDICALSSSFLVLLKGVIFIPAPSADGATPSSPDSPTAEGLRFK